MKLTRTAGRVILATLATKVGVEHAVVTPEVAKIRIKNASIQKKIDAYEKKISALYKLQESVPQPDCKRHEIPALGERVYSYGKDQAALVERVNVRLNEAVLAGSEIDLDKLFA